MNCYIGWDNGIGTLAVTYSDRNATTVKTPIRKCLNYTKKKGFISRLDYDKTKKILKEFIKDSDTCICYLERPLVNPTRFKATISGIRILEAQETILEELKIPYRFIDSKEWQKVMLPSGVSGKDLKIICKQVASRLFPYLEQEMKKLKDCDALLIAEYARSKSK